ncbi:collagen alpha-2(I) chain-like [Eschrichtius robustus]|uniref:collagen alpha-2(I) chain-like n=1 Tax=Eschrichtius robustus TaxID=9764 RepID=UPI0035BFE840
MRKTCPCPYCLRCCDRGLRVQYPARVVRSAASKRRGQEVREPFALFDRRETWNSETFINSVQVTQQAAEPGALGIRCRHGELHSEGSAGSSAPRGAPVQLPLSGGIGQAWLAHAVWGASVLTPTPSPDSAPEFQRQNLRAAGAQSVELRWDCSSRGPGPVVIPAPHRLGAALGLPEDTSCVKRGIVQADVSVARPPPVSVARPPSPWRGFLAGVQELARLRVSAGIPELTPAVHRSPAHGSPTAGGPGIRPGLAPPAPLSSVCPTPHCPPEGPRVHRRHTNPPGLPGLRALVGAGLLGGAEISRAIQTGDGDAGVPGLAIPRAVPSAGGQGRGGALELSDGVPAQRQAEEGAPLLRRPWWRDLPIPTSSREGPWAGAQGSLDCYLPATGPLHQSPKPELLSGPQLPGSLSQDRPSALSPQADSLGSLFPQISQPFLSFPPVGTTQLRGALCPEQRAGTFTLSAAAAAAHPAVAGEEPCTPPTSRFQHNSCAAQGPRGAQATRPRRAERKGSICAEPGGAPIRTAGEGARGWREAQRPRPGGNPEQRPLFCYDHQDVSRPGQCPGGEEHAVPLAESCHFGPRRSVAPGSPWEEDAVEEKTAGGDAGLPPAAPPVLPRSAAKGPWAEGSPASERLQSWAVDTSTAVKPTADEGIVKLPLPLTRAAVQGHVEVRAGLLLSRPPQKPWGAGQTLGRHLALTLEAGGASVLDLEAGPVVFCPTRTSPEAPGQEGKNRSLCITLRPLHASFSAASCGPFPRDAGRLGAAPERGHGLVPKPPQDPRRAPETQRPLCSLPPAGRAGTSGTSYGGPAPSLTELQPKTRPETTSCSQPARPSP